MDDRVELVVTAVVAAEGERAARSACRQLRWQVEGRVVEVADCSAEEPDCWSVVIRVPCAESATNNVGAALARAVRQFVRRLGPGLAAPRVSCEPPTAWTVLDDPDVLASLVPGAERLLVEAWCGGDPYPAEDGEPAEEPAWPSIETPVPREPATASLGGDGGCRLTLLVDVATGRAAGAEWQARALASRISRNATLTSITEHEDGLRVRLDLGSASTPAPQTVLTAVSALDRSGWSPLRWEGETAITSWVADPRPTAGITALELSSSPDH